MSGFEARSVGAASPANRYSTSKLPVETALSDRDADRTIWTISVARASWTLIGPDDPVQRCPIERVPYPPQRHRGRSFARQEVRKGSAVLPLGRDASVAYRTHGTSPVLGARTPTTGHPTARLHRLRWSWSIV